MAINRLYRFEDDYIHFRPIDDRKIDAELDQLVNAVNDLYYNTPYLKNEFYPERYGAKGDLSNDDTDAINEAISVAHGAGGGKVVLTKKYLVGKEGMQGRSRAGQDMLCIELKDNVLIEMRPGSLIRLAPQAGRSSPPYPEAHIFYAGIINTAQGTQINRPRRNIFIFGPGMVDCDYPNQPTGGTHNITNIQIKECSKIRIQNLELVGGVAETCYIMGTHPDEDETDLIIMGNNIHDTGEWGVDALGIHVDRCNGFTIVGNTIHNVGLRGIGVGLSFDGAIIGNYVGRNYDGGIRIVGSHDLSVVGNALQDCNEYGIEISPEDIYDCYDIAVTGNKIYGNAWNGRVGIIVINSAEIVINGNTISTMKWDGSSDFIVAGIAVILQNNANSRNIEVIGNFIENIDPGYSGSGLTIAPAGIVLRGQDTTYRLYNISIIGNRVYNCYNGIWGDCINGFIHIGNNYRDYVNNSKMLTNISIQGTYMGDYNLPP